MLNADEIAEINRNIKARIGVLLQLERSALDDPDRSTRAWIDETNQYRAELRRLWKIQADGLQE